MAIETKLTYSRYRELPDDDPCEREMIVGEEFCVPSPSYLHQWVRHLLASLLRQFVRERGLGAVVSPVDLYDSEYDCVDPDVSYLTREEHRQRVGKQRIELPPPLDMEILLPPSVRWDRENKRRFYQAFGVLEHWIVDPIGQAIEVVDLVTGEAATSDPAVSRVLADFHVEVAQLFAEAQS